MRPRHKRLRSKFSPTSPLQNRKKSLRGKASNIPLKWEATHACESRRIVGGDIGKQGEWGRVGPSKKIEQEASSDCHYSEYLTLLNTSQDGTTRDRQGPTEYTLRGVVESTPPND